MPAAPKADSKEKQAAGSAKDGSPKKRDDKSKAGAPKSGTATESTPKSGAGATPAPGPVPLGGKPDQTAYNKEQDDLKKQIDELNQKVIAAKEKISHATKSGPNDERRKQLRAEMDELRAQQGDGKSSREKILTQLKAVNESVAQKIKDLQAAKGKSQFKSLAELDAHIKKLDGQVESGNMKLVDERRAIQDISTAKRQRRVIEGYQAQQDAIDAEKAKADELRKQLDDPELKAVSERYDAIKTELDQLKKEGDEAYASRNVLYDERNALQAEMDALWSKKKEASQRYREAQDAYWAKVQEDRAKKAEKFRAARQAAEDEKKKDVIDRLREEASEPAYQAQIQDCQTLIDQLSGNASSSSTGLNFAREGPASVPELDLRKVDEAIDKNLTPMKKKGDDTDNYFITSKKPKASKKGGPAKANGGIVAPDPTPAVPAASEKLKISLQTLSALASFSIPPPTTSAEVPQTIENLKIKKEWFLANQEKQTAANKTKAEREIESLLRSMEGHGINGAAADGSAASQSESPKAPAAAVQDAVEV